MTIATTLLSFDQQPIQQQDMTVLTRAVVSDDNPVKQEFQLPGEICSLVVALLSLPAIAVFFFGRLKSVRNRSFTVASVTLLLVSG